MAPDKRTIIINAARGLFRSKGLGGSTMEEVARSAGMGKSSLYYYFKSQEEILDAVLESEIGEIIQETIRQMSLQKGLLSKLIVFASVKHEMIRKRRALYGATEAGTDAEAASRNHAYKKIIHTRYLQKEIIIMQQLLANALESGEINELNRVAIDDIIFTFLASLRGINREIILHSPGADAISKISFFCKIFYQGLE